MLNVISKFYTIIIKNKNKSNGSYVIRNYGENERNIEYINNGYERINNIKEINYSNKDFDESPQIEINNYINRNEFPKKTQKKYNPI